MSIFHFKQFSILQKDAAMRVGTDAMVLGALIDPSEKKHGLDIGAGTGVLSLMTAQNNVEILVDAVELDEASFNECKQNFETSSWNERLTIYHTDFLKFTPTNKYDLIFSNPPYYQTTLPNEDARSANAKHVQTLSPLGLFKKAESLLTERGVLWIIVPFSDLENWCHAAKSCGLYLTCQVQLVGRRNKAPNRAVLCFERVEVMINQQQLTVREEDGKYTQEYIDLTVDYHATDLSK